MELYGWFLQEQIIGAAITVAVLAAIALAYSGVPLFVWSVLILFGLVGFGAPWGLIGLVTVALLVFNLPFLRAPLVSALIMKAMKAAGLIPKVSDTERAALEAGVVWREADLFSGRPDFEKLMSEPYPQLTEEEQAFLDGPCEELCNMVDDWEIYKTKVIPEKAMTFIKEKGFLGMIIPKEYGGLGMSNALHSEVIGKLSSRSLPISILVMVPNSLGPAELLVHYGTQDQKDKYLKGLATGKEIPCFGLTEPQAGSDAGSITSDGILFKDENGELKMRLNWKKRWITLASISTIIGLAFRLRDPDNLLGQGEDLGITCALIPSDTPGVVLGRRHDPLGIPFHNCPMEGRDVVVSAEDCIIGGIEMAGKGWKMLMESLGAGRGISLPAQTTFGTKLASRVVSNHATIRKQFGLPIGRFEGVAEPIARVAARAYYVDAMRNYVLSALDQGIKPPIVTAIAKYNATEEGKKAISDAMDILAGAGISMGPRNLLAIGYIGAPISVTVEGANILTRTLMIFGQGAFRAHPYAFQEVSAVERNDVKSFDRAFWAHVGHVGRNKARAFVLSLTRGYLAGTPGGRNRRHYQRLAWASASFAFFADVAMATLGGKLKVKENLTGRFADILSWLFIGTAVLRRFEAEGRQKDDELLVDYSMSLVFHNIQEAFDGIFSNFDIPVLGLLFRGPIRWWSRINSISSLPRDKMTLKVSTLLLDNQQVRDRLSKGIFIPKDPEQALGRLEQAYLKIKQTAPIEKKIKKAIRAKKLPKKRIVNLLDQAVQQSVITADERALIAEAEALRWDAIQVDDFSEEEYLPGGLRTSPKTIFNQDDGLTSGPPTGVRPLSS